MVDLQIETQYSHDIVAGVDEVGRGSIAGPVFAGAVIINQNHIIAGINDSKKLSPTKRKDLYNQITQHYICAIGIASVAEINELNILEATKIACARAIASLNTQPTVILIDGNMKFNDHRYVSVVRGDQLSLSIAAASIIAKVSRDKFIENLGMEYPEFMWDKNKGYPTLDHINRVRMYGRTIHHRNFNF